MTEQPKPVKKVVRVEDLATTVKLKKVQAQADLAERKAQAAAEAEIRKADAEARQMAAKVELQRLKLSMTAREAASRHLAHFAGLYMFLSVIAFLFAVTTLEGDLVAVVAGLITLVVTTIGGLLRSIVSEGDTEKPGAQPSGETEGE